MSSTRRGLLKTVTLGGALALAGCGQNESTPATGTSSMSSQSFRAPISQHPAKTAFYRGGEALQSSAYASVAKEPASWNLRRFLWQPGVGLTGKLVPVGQDTRILYNWIEELDITPTEVTITIQDDAKWSDGHPFTGRDLAVRPLERTLVKFYSPPVYAPSSQGKPQGANFAFDDFEIGDKSVTYRSSEGYFEEYWNIRIAYRLGPAYPSPEPTHIEPYDAYADAIIETARRAQAGEIYPWYKKRLLDPSTKSLIKEHLANPKYVRKFSKPKNVVASGAWDIVALDGTNFEFEPNPHHPHADAINFDRFIFVYTPSDERERAALKADRLDYTSPGLTPQTVVDALPDHIKYLRVPNPYRGNELKINHTHPALGIREVRAALMYALDQETIANNIHQSIAVPVTTPGGDCWDAIRYVGRDWIDQNLITYSTDRKRAASLMRAAGYTNDGGQWMGNDGTPLTLTLPTPSNTPKWEPTVASQLSEFGINTTVRTVDDIAFRNRVEQGKFDIWAPTDGSALTTVGARALREWKHQAQKTGTGIYPAEQYEMGDFSNSGTPIPRTEQRYRVFTIKAPPVGQPDGLLQEYHPAALALAFQTNPPPKEFRRRVKLALWLGNWVLPTIPINKRYVQHFIDDAHWQWPTDAPQWQSFVNGDFWPAGDVLGNLALRANPDNPEQ